MKKEFRIVRANFFKIFKILLELNEIRSLFYFIFYYFKLPIWEMNRLFDIVFTK